MQQIESSTPSTISTVPKHVPVDVSSALPANKTRAFLQDRLFKRRRSNTVAGPSSRKRRGRQEEKPHLIFDPLLDKKPAKKEKTRTEKKEALRERMRGRQGGACIQNSLYVLYNADNARFLLSFSCNRFYAWEQPDDGCRIWLQAAVADVHSF